MLYEVLPGACDESFGIHVARFAQFPAEVIELAESNVARLEQFNKMTPRVNANPMSLSARLDLHQLHAEPRVGPKVFFVFVRCHPYIETDLLP